MLCTRANLLILQVRDNNALIPAVGWAIMYPPGITLAAPHYITNPNALYGWSFNKPLNTCATVHNPHRVGMCNLVFASVEDVINSYGKFTLDEGHTEAIIPLAGRVLIPRDKPYNYDQARTFALLKHYGYWNKEGTNTENSFTMLMTARPVMTQSTLVPNKVFGTPIEIIDRVIQTQSEYNTVPKSTAQVRVNVVNPINRDGQNRIIEWEIELSATTSGVIKLKTDKPMFGKFTGDTIRADLLSIGDRLLIFQVKGFDVFRVNVEYDEDYYAGVELTEFS